MQGRVELPVRRLRSDATLPRYATEAAAGMDLAAALDNSMMIMPGAWATVPTGIAIALPQGYEAQVRPRSGLAARLGVTVLNAPGTIDADYRGELKVVLINHGPERFVVKHGDRIAQLVIAAVAPALVREVDLLDETARGSSGFGSTGV
ncbi:MAG: dUTP diphosphatase [Myxococcota bacterium]